MKKGRFIIFGIISIGIISFSAASAGGWSSAVRPRRFDSESGARGPVLLEDTCFETHLRPWRSRSADSVYRPRELPASETGEAVSEMEPSAESAVEETAVAEKEPEKSAEPEVIEPATPAVLTSVETEKPAEPEVIEPEKPAEPPPPKPQKPAAAASYGKIPPYFIKNEGQLDSAVLYYVKGPRGTVYLTDTEVVFDFLREIPKKDAGAELEEPRRPDREREEPEEYERLVFRKKFRAPNPEMEVKGEEELPGKINYFVGSRQNWRSNIPTVEKVVYQNIYQGIDMESYFQGGNPAFSYQVHPGADPGRLIFDYQGVDELRLKPSGELVIITRFGGFLSPPPRAYQKIEGKETEVESSFRLLKDNAYPGALKRIEVHGAAGSAVLEEEDITFWKFAEETESDRELLKRMAGKTETGGGAADPAAIGHHGHAAQFKDVLHAIENNTRPLIDGREGRRSVEIILAIYKAAESGQPVKLPLHSDPVLNSRQSGGK